MEQFIGALSGLSIVAIMPLVQLFKTHILRKDVPVVSWLVANALTIGFAFAVNWVGKYELDPQTVISMAMGVGNISMGAHSVLKTKKKLKK